MKLRRRQFDLRRAFSLIEVVIAVIVLAIAVPPTLNMMDSAGAGRVDAINTTRATLMATSVMETVLADITSSNENLGFEALDDTNAYLRYPNEGLYFRLSSALEPYTRVGLNYTVDISDLVSQDGTISEDESDNIFRVITVRVSFQSASTASYEVPMSTIVSAL